MIHIKIELEAINETWRIGQILIDKDGEPYLVRHLKSLFLLKNLQNAMHSVKHERFSKGTSALGMEILSGRCSLPYDVRRCAKFC
jgi:hypothetical protein